MRPPARGRSGPPADEPADPAAPPSWRSADLVRRWNVVRSDELSRFFSATRERHLDADLVERAVAFGWGSYHAADLTTLWGPALESRLGAEWEITGPSPGAAWSSVVRAVRHGWERASASSDAEAASAGRAADPSA